MSGMREQTARDSKITQPPETVRVHKILGQLHGIEKMLTERRPLSQVVQQVQAAVAGLSSLKAELLKRHLEICLDESTKTGDYGRLLYEVAHIMRMQAKR